MARQLKPNPDAECALDFISKYQLTEAQIAYRYTVEQIRDLCAEIGLPPVEGEKEDAMVTRLSAAVLGVNLSKNVPNPGAAL